MEIDENILVGFAKSIEQDIMENLGIYEKPPSELHEWVKEDQSSTTRYALLYITRGRLISYTVFSHFRRRIMGLIALGKINFLKLTHDSQISEWK